MFSLINNYRNVIRLSNDYNRYDIYIIILKGFSIFFFNKDTTSKLSFFRVFFLRYEDKPDIFHQDILQTQSAIGTVFFS